MRNFVLGLALGSLVTYWYVRQGDGFQGAIADLWQRASAPPASAPAKR
jgi:hypothetical protein